MRGDAGEVFRDRADIAVDGPLVVVQHDDEFLRVRGHVVHRLKHRTAGEGGVTGHADDVLVGAVQIARRGHAERGTQRGARVTGAVAIVLALRAQAEAIEAFVLADGADLVPAAGEHFVHVGLMRDVEDETVLWRFKHAVHRDGKLHHAEIRPEMAAGLAEGLDERAADFFGKRGQFLRGQGFQIGRGMNGRQVGVHG